jgi:hypothetical protein
MRQTIASSDHETTSRFDALEDAEEGDLRVLLLGAEARAADGHELGIVGHGAAGRRLEVGHRGTIPSGRGNRAAPQAPSRARRRGRTRRPAAEARPRRPAPRQTWARPRRSSATSVDRPEGAEARDLAAQASGEDDQRGAAAGSEVAETTRPERERARSPGRPRASSRRPGRRRAAGGRRSCAGTA